MKTQSTKTLLERALEFELRRSNEEISDDQIELAFAYLEDKVTHGQVAQALGMAKGQSPAGWIIKRLRRACSQGKLVIKRQ